MQHQQKNLRTFRLQTGIYASLLLLVFSPCAFAIDWDFNNVSYGPEDRQWMNIALPDTNGPHGIFFWAHPNGSTAFDLAQDSANAMLQNGYAVISWESVERLQTNEDVEVSWADAQIVFDFVRANAANWNLDPGNILIGGRSRGSVASWQLAHSAHPAIKGIYMYNALPESVWVGGNDPWVALVTEQSPPTYLVYGPSWGHEDAHRPDNVIPIQQRYESLGIADRFTLYQDMWGDFTDENGRWTNEFRDAHYFPEFLSSVFGPKVASIQLDGAAAQRSSVESLTLTFDGEVDFQPGAFSVIQRSNATEETLESVSIGVVTQFEDDQTTATVTFDSHTRNSVNALVDGNYQLTLTASLVKCDGHAMLADYVYGDEESESFYSFYGDSNGDRRVNILDVLDFSWTFLKVDGDPLYNFAFDYDANGIVGIFDLRQLRRRFLKLLPFAF